MILDMFCEEDIKVVVFLSARMGIFLFNARTFQSRASCIQTKMGAVKRKVFTRTGKRNP